MASIEKALADLDARLLVVHAQLSGVTQQHALVEKSEIHGEVHLFSSSLQFLKECKRQHADPLCQVVLDMLLSHCQRFGDEGWFCAGFYANLRSAAQRLHASVADIQQGFKLMNDLCLHFLSSSNCMYSYPLHWSDSENILLQISSVLRPHIGSHLLLTAAQTQLLASQLLEAFITSLHPQQTCLVPHVLFRAIDYHCFQSTCYNNSVILDIEIPRYFPTSGIRNCRVALFDASLELPHVSASLVLTDSLASVEAQMLKQFVAVCVSANIQLIITQRRMHPYLQLLLHRNDIVALPRASIMHIGQVQRISGAQLLGGMGGDALEESNIGFIQHLQIVKSGEKRLLLATADASCDAIENALPLTHATVRSRMFPCATLLLQMPSEHSRIELQNLCERVIKVLTHMLENNEVLVGGGCWQMCLVRQLRTCLAKIDARPLRNVCEAFADALEKCVTKNETIDASKYTVTSQINEKNIETIYFSSPVAGRASTSITRADGEIIKELESAECIDVASACINAISTAVDTCLCALDVDGVFIDKVE